MMDWKISALCPAACSALLVLFTASRAAAQDGEGSEVPVKKNPPLIDRRALQIPGRLPEMKPVQGGSKPPVLAPGVAPGTQPPADPGQPPVPPPPPSPKPG